MGATRRGCVWTVRALLLYPGSALACDAVTRWEAASLWLLAWGPGLAWAGVELWALRRAASAPGAPVSDPEAERLLSWGSAAAILAAGYYLWLGPAWAAALPGARLALEALVRVSSRVKAWQGR